jgi:ribosomal protein S11
MADDKKRVKRRDKKNISSGVAHVNSTLITQ